MHLNSLSIEIEDLDYLVPKRKPVLGRKVAQMQGAEKFTTGAY